jgi:hypothetical protein
MRAWRAARRTGAVNIAAALIAAAAASASGPVCGGGDHQTARFACAADEWCAAQVDTLDEHFAVVWGCACSGRDNSTTLLHAIRSAQAAQEMPLCGSGQNMSAGPPGDGGVCARVLCRCDRMTGPAFTWSENQHSCDHSQSDLITPTLSLALCLQIMVSTLGLALALSRWPMDK